MRNLWFYVVLFTIPTWCHASLVQLDALFGANHNGTVLTPIASDAEAMGLVVQADSKIVVVGNCIADETGYMAAARYTTAGVLDTDFGDQGIFTASFEGGSMANECALQADGKIVLVGAEIINNSPQFALARVTTSGALDSTFGTAGVAVLPTYGTATSATIASNGKIIVAGASAQQARPILSLTRLNSNGSVDTSFGKDGYVTISVGSRLQDGAIATDADGKIVITGYTTLNNIQKIFVARLNTDGSLDSGFGTAGIVTTEVGTIASQAYALAIQDDGKIVVSGQADGSCVILRYATSGTLDTSFGTDGVALLAIGNSSAGYAVRVQSNGSILVGGQSDDHCILARVTSAGALDSTFGTDGTLATSLGKSDKIYGLQLQTDGKSVAVGPVDANFGVLRCLSSNADMVAITTPATGSTITSDTFQIAGVSSQSSKTVRVKIDGNVLASQTTSITGSWDAGSSYMISNGSHTITADLLDGDTVLATATSTVTVSVSNKIIMQQPADNSQVLITNPPITGQASLSSATILLLVDAVPFAVPATTDSLGRWSFFVTPTLSNSQHSLTAQLWYGQSMVAQTTNTFTVQVRPTCPNLFVINGQFSTTNPPIILSGSGTSCPPYCDFQVEKIAPYLFQLTLLPVVTSKPTIFASPEKIASTDVSVSVRDSSVPNTATFFLNGEADEIHFAATAC